MSNEKVVDSDHSLKNSNDADVDSQQEASGSRSPRMRDLDTTALCSSELLGHNDGDSGSGAEDKSKRTEMSHSSASEPPMVTRDLDTLIKDVLPAELKLVVLKEYVRLWATRVVAGPLVPFRDKSFDKAHKSDLWLNSLYGQTNRALLIHVCTLTLGEGWREQRLPESRIGWCSLPIYSPGYGPCSFHMETTISIPKLLNPAIPLLFSGAWDPIRIAKILEPTSCSKDFNPALRKFFFGHMTWAFTRASQFLDMVIHDSCRLPSDVLKAMKSFSLEIGDDWDQFVHLFKNVFEVLSGSANPFPNLRRLEINSVCYNAKKINSFNSRVVDQKVRTRYLVTRCFQLAKLLPNLTIVLSGISKNSETKLDPLEHPLQNGHRVRDVGLGYSVEEVQQFSSCEVRLPSLEVLKDDETYEFYRPEDVHWKMLFVDEWRSVWDLGLDDANEKEGYDAVFEYKPTQDIYDSDDDEEESVGTIEDRLEFELWEFMNERPPNFQ